MSEDSNSAIRTIFKGASIVYAGLIIQYFISFAAQVVTANLLPAGGFGNVITGTAVIDLGAIIGTIGLNIGLARNLPRESSRSERIKIANAAYLTAIPLSIAVALGIVLNSQYIASTIFSDQSISTSITIFGATVPFAVLYNLSTGGIRGQEISRYRVYLRNIIQPVTRMGIISVVAIYGLGEIGFLAGYAVPYAVVGVVSTYLFTKALPGFNVIGRTDWKTVKELVDFSLPISVSNATGFVIRSSDIFLVLYFLSNEAVGAYGVVYSLSQLVRMFSTAFNFLGMPVASKLESDENLGDALRVNESILRWLAVLSAPALFPMLAYPEFIISFIYGQDYTAGSAALVVLASGFAIHNVFSPNRSLLTATGHTKTMMGNNIVTSALNLILNLVLIPQYGVLGAAIATVAAYLFRDAVVVLELRMFTGRYTVTSRVINPILIAIPTMSVMGYFALEIEATVYSLILLTTCTSVVYIALVIVILGITPEEQMLVDSVEEKYGISFWLIDKIVDRFSTK